MDDKDKYLHAVVGVPSDEELIEAIANSINDLPADYDVISTSHDVLINPDGSLLWTALITAKLI